MANKQRYLFGDARPTKLPWKLAYAIYQGDMVYKDANDTVVLPDDGTPTLQPVKAAGSLAWQAGVDTPSAPTVADTASDVNSGLTNALTGVKVSYNFPWGEGALSDAGTATPTAQAGLILTAVALPTNVLSRNIYVETAAGSGTYKLYGVDHGEATIITGYGVGRTPPTAVSTGNLQVTQYTFAQSFMGVSAQFYNGTDATYGVKDGYVRVDAGGTFFFDCASANFDAGDLVGPAQASTNALEPQKVVAVADKALAIGRVHEGGDALTVVRVDVFGNKRILSQELF